MPPQLNKSHKVRKVASRVFFWESTETNSFWNRSNMIGPFIEPAVDNVEEIGEDIPAIEIDSINIYEWPEIDFTKFGKNGIYTKADCTMETILRMSPVYDPTFSNPPKRSLLERAVHRLGKRAREAKYAISSTAIRKPKNENNQKEDSCKGTNKKSEFSSF
ncbi:unnamed protein product [Owenia fusiformis]|uniref:Uncharacterized protein n=1 Tax=Owenia fusiformis TaxID=6347 RepID=A0A8S4NQA0_OWEFU|nr:unnamed protein product [Owenia fusiformis]